MLHVLLLLYGCIEFSADFFFYTKLPLNVIEQFLNKCKYEYMEYIQFQIIVNLAVIRQISILLAAAQKIAK